MRIATPREAAEIAARHERGETKTALARAKGLSVRTVYRICVLRPNLTPSAYVRCKGCGGRIRRGRPCVACSALALKGQTLATKRRLAA